MVFQKSSVEILEKDDLNNAGIRLFSMNFYWFEIRRVYLTRKDKYIYLYFSRSSGVLVVNQCLLIPGCIFSCT